MGNGALPEMNRGNGFTLCKFSDAAHNRRTDRYGGDAAGRVRILTELLLEIRANTHEKFIVSVRMGEYLPTSEDGVEVAKIFEQAGIDMLHISFNLQQPPDTVPQEFICSPVTYSACRMKKAVNIPVIAVNEIRSAEQVRFLLENDYVDLVAIGRGMFADPQFANHVIRGEAVNKCLGCGDSDARKCLWFTDHTKCPAAKKLSGGR
jgi:NADPH2 dehydrogenase